MPFNIFQKSPLITNTLKQPTDLIRKTEDRQDPNLRRRLEPFFQMGVKNKLAEGEIQTFHAKKPAQQATILAILTDMTKEKDKSIQRMGYDYLSQIMSKTKGEEAKNRLTAMLYSNARAHYLELSQGETTKANPASHLSDLELAVLQFAPQKSTFKHGGYSQTLQLNSGQITEAIKERDLDTASKKWNFSDLESVTLARFLQAGRDMKQVGHRSIRESLRKWTGGLGAVRLANEKEVAQTAKKELALRQLLTTFPQRPQAAGLIDRFGTFRTRVMTDALIARTLLSMVRDPDQRVVRAGYDHIAHIMKKNDSVKTKLLAHMYNDICNSALRDRAEANSIERNLQSLSQFELSVLKSASPTGVLLNPGGQSKSAGSELTKCMDNKTFSDNQPLNSRCISGDLSFSDLLDLVKEQREKANRRVTNDPLYPREEPTPVPVSRRTNWSTVQKRQQAVAGMLEEIRKNPSRKTKKPLLLGLHAFARKEDRSIDKGLLTAVVDASASADVKKSKLGYAILKNLIGNQRTRERAMHLLLEDTFYRIEQARREILVHQDGSRNWSVSEQGVNERILRKLPEINLLTLHYYNPEKLNHTEMQKLKANKEINIPRQFFLDPTKYKEEKNGVYNYPDTVDAILAFCTGKANLFKKEAKKLSTMDLITLKAMLSQMNQVPESSPPAPSIAYNTNMKYNNLNELSENNNILDIYKIQNINNKEKKNIFDFGSVQKNPNLNSDDHSIENIDFVEEFSDNSDHVNNVKVAIERTEKQKNSNLKATEMEEQMKNNQTTNENIIVNKE